MATPDAELKVRIEAELSKFANGLKKGSSDTQQFATTVDAILKRVSDTAKRTGDTLGGAYAKGSAQAAFATTNLSRVLQDAPFGFIGIQNNLNPLLESFGQLRKEAGSNSAALKALGSSLIGPAGLGLALAAVSAGILLYNEYQRKASKETKAVVDANKELAESIKSISEVQQEGRKNASAELSNLQTLYKATQNVNIPQQERLKIAKELLEKYPTYLKGLTAEGVLAGEAATEYTKLTNAILAKGYAQAAEENRQKLINQQLNATVDRTREQIKLTKLNTEAKKRESQIQGTLDIQGRNALTPGLQKVQKQAEESRQAIIGFNKVIADGTTEIKLLDNVVQGLIKDFGSEVLFDSEKPKKLRKEAKTVADIFKQLDIDLKKVDASVDGTFGDKSKERVSAFAKAIDELVTIGIKPTEDVIKGIQKRLLNVGDIDFVSERTGEKGIINFGKAVDRTIGQVQAKISNIKPFNRLGEVEGYNIPEVTQRLISPFQQLNDYIGTQVFPQLQSGFENFFNDILEKGSFSFGALGQAILKTFTSVLASEATKGILGLLNPAQTSLQKGGKGLFGLLAGLGGAKAGATSAAAAAGAGATGGLLLPILGGIAAGGLIASLFKKKPEPKPAFNSYSNTSSNIGSDSFTSGSVVFQISGANLIGVLNRAGQRLERFNGNP